MNRNRSAQRHIEEPLINLTPLIDVVFVILIMFIVIAPLLDLDRVELADASSYDSKESISIQEASPISIYVHRDNAITFNNQPVSLDQLPTLLLRAKKQHPNARPHLYHDKKAQFGIYQAIKNAAEEAGFHQMDVVLKP